jgi:hypothetical protein
MNRPRIHLVSCKQLPEPDADEELLNEALVRAGAEPVVCGWDDPAVDWSRAPIAVIRSTWNYFLLYEEFLKWVKRASAVTRLYNSPRVVVWNSHKAYLLELEQRGFPIIPTELVVRNSAPSLKAIAGARGWSHVVVKPAVSGGSLFTQQFRDAELESEGEKFLAGHARERDMMVQPYVRSVDGYGERSLIWLGGQLSHAIRKSPRFIGNNERVSHTSLPIAPEERAFAEKVIEATRGDDELVYARVDIARDENDQPMLMEVELIEPSLFLKQEPGSADRLAKAIISRV